MSDVLHINGMEQFQSEVKEFNGVVVLDFYADRCGPCRMLAPIMSELHEENADKNVKIVKVNTDENQELAMQFQVTGIPSVFIIVNGDVKENLVGVQPKGVYQEKIDQYLEENMIGIDDEPIKMAA